jgi:hypothetical protein
MGDIMKLMEIIQQKDNLMEDMYNRKRKAQTVVTAPPSAAATGGGALPDTAATGVTAGTSSTSENGIDALGA